jgi:hypothetical protein
MGMFDEVLNNVGEVRGGGKGFEYGTHEVIVGMIEPKQKKTKNDPKTEVIEVTVFDPADDERTATATLYFHTEGGARMSVAKILGIMVHNVGEEKKDAVRELGKKLFGGIDDPTKARDVAAKLMADKFMGSATKPGYKAFAVAEPNGKYKTTNYVDIWHYPAEPQNDAASKDPLAGATPVTAAEADELPDFGDL